MKPKHLVPNVLTLGNIAFGFLGIVAAAQGNFERAVWFLFGAAWCDLLDGRLARILDATSKFGMELDSLSDMISFGLAPAVLVYLSVLRPLGVLGIVIATAYILCGALRLARFNTATPTELQNLAFYGVPIPIAAGYVWSFVMVRDGLPPWLIAAGTALMAGLMVSHLKVPKFRKGEGPPIAMMLLGIVFFSAFLVRPVALTWHVWNGWNVVIMVTNYVFLWRRRRQPVGPAPTEA